MRAASHRVLVRAAPRKTWLGGKKGDGDAPRPHTTTNRRATHPQNRTAHTNRNGYTRPEVRHGGAIKKSFAFGGEMGVGRGFMGALTPVVDGPPAIRVAVGDTQDELTVVELDALTDGFPPAEHTLELLCEADSRASQIEAIKTSWSAPNRPIPADGLAGVLGKLNKADSRCMQLRVLQHAAARLATFASLDAAAKPLFMPGPSFRHASKLVLCAAARGSLQPEAFAELLDNLMDERGCFLSAAQAQELVDSLAVPPDRQFRYWHVACSRVVDRWNVRESSHAAGACPYGWDAAYTLKLAAACGTRPSPVALQCKVLAAIGHGDPEHAHASRVAEFAARIVAVNIGAGSSSSC